MRYALNHIREEVNELKAENEKLKQQNEKLAESEKKLREVEQQLYHLSVLQGKSVDELTKQVEEYKKVSKQMEENLKSNIIQNLVNVIFTADCDRDYVIDPEEVANLKLRLGTIDGVDFSEDNFNKALTKAGYDPSKVDIHSGGYSINAVIEVLRNLMDDGVPAEENIFVIKPQK
jgi:predicted nuclease with TOPRIM domain